MDQLAYCSECDIWRPVDLFAKKRNGLNHRCKPCHNLHTRICRQLAVLHPKPEHGLCADCGQAKRLEIDHDHRLASLCQGLDSWRAWLCRACNTRRAFNEPNIK